ncbi:hypothetical protein IAR55_000113 [Kwoniella newhampshirensis]|uniref:Cytochrome P450 n=1 Tax=Kwoniella newhampshirensis TaxID=1651941 RepID=A0AAW0Z5Z8_9TREE
MEPQQPRDTTYFRPPTVLEILLLGLAYLGYLIFNTFVYKPCTSPLKDLPGPPGGTSRNGHVNDIINMHSNTVLEWIDTYGPTFLVRGPYGVHHRIFTVDTRALNHVLSHDSIYTKTGIVRRLIRRYIKEGLLVSEGDRHRVQKKVAQKLFVGNGFKGTGVMVREEAHRLRQVLTELCSNPNLTTPYSPHNADMPESHREVDMYKASTRSMFDVIGRVSIDHHFNTIGDWEGEGSKLFKKLVHMQQPTGGNRGLRLLLSLYFPIVDKIWACDNSNLVNEAMDTLGAIARKTKSERQIEIDQGRRESEEDNRDLLTMMLRHNSNESLGHDQKLSDEEIEGQLATFLFAGSETTASTLSLGLYHMSCDPAIQTRLRTEILACEGDLPYEQIDELPYLDAVAKEIFRMEPAISGTIRQAQKDDIIPLAQPVQLNDGRVVSELKIRKGQLVHVPIEHLHRSTSIWGPAAGTFDPNRFYSPPLRSSDQIHESASSRSSKRDDGPGITSNFMTFLDGPRRCVGYKLAIMEVKLILYTLLREFEFGLVQGGGKILRWNMLSNRPFVSGTLTSRGSRLPLVIKPYRGDDTAKKDEVEVK